MSSLTFMGREYDTDELVREAVGLAQDLAKNARLEQPLPVNTDLSEAEQNEIQSQIPAMLALPSFVLDAFWAAFSAHHLVALASSLPTLSPVTQPKAISSLIQILSLLPDPKFEPYFRRFLRHPQISKGLPTLIATAFVRGIEWKRPSGPGHICTLIIHLLFWCDPSQGDDGKASIDADVRSELARKLEMLMESPDLQRLEETQRLEFSRLHGILECIQAIPDDAYLTSTRQHLENQLDVCANPSCSVVGDLTCSKCKSVRYCGKECQTWHWKNGHKLQCLQANY